MKNCTDHNNSNTRGVTHSQREASGTESVTLFHVWSLHLCLTLSSVFAAAAVPVQEIKLVFYKEFAFF